MRNVLSTRRRKALVTAIICGIVGVSALAFAAWLQSATGNGRTQVGTLSQDVVAYPADTSGEAACLPGGTCDVKANFDNTPNSVPVTVTGATVNSLAEDTGGGATKCGASLTATTPVTGLSIVVPPGHAQDIVIPNAVQLASNAPSACQGQTYTIGLTVQYQAGS
jgi:hypothetical protein